MQAFVDMKKFINTNAGIFQRLDKVEQKLIQSDEYFNKLFNALENRSIEPKQDIFSLLSDLLFVWIMKGVQYRF